MPDEEKRADEPQAEPGRAETSVDDAEIIEEKARSAEPAQPPAPPPARSGGGGSFVGMVLGGVLAAGAGFGLAQIVPQGWPFAPSGQSDSRLTQQAAEIEALKASVAELAARPAPDVDAALSALKQEVEARFAALPAPPDPAAAIDALSGKVEADLGALQARLDAVEKASTGTDGGASALAVAAFERDLAALRSRIDELAGGGSAAAGQIEQAVASARAELAAAVDQARQLEAQAADVARDARRDAALGRLSAALETGGPYASAVTELTEAGIEVPASLADHAETGVPTLVDLQRDFTPAARRALDAALRADVGEGWGERLGTFLRTQTGARSLQPRAGDDPDAILSRADAALQAGDVALAFSELEALPEAARTALSDWMAEAQTREAAVAALASVAGAADTQ